LLAYANNLTLRLAVGMIQYDSVGWQKRGILCLGLMSLDAAAAEYMFHNAQKKLYRWILKG
jgi:hypothetical protein